MSLFLAGIDDRNWLIDAEDVERAAERYAEGMKIPVGGSMEVAVRPALGGESVTVFVANGGAVFGSTAGFVFVPSHLFAITTE